MTYTQKNYWPEKIKGKKKGLSREVWEVDWLILEQEKQRTSWSTAWEQGLPGELLMVIKHFH